MITDSQPRSSTITTFALSPYIACVCGQLLAPQQTMCATCKANGGQPRANRTLVMGRDGYPVGILDTDASEHLPAKMIAAPAEKPAAVSTSDLYQEMKAAEEIYIRYMRLDTFDLPADHATYKRKVAAHVAFLRAQAAYLGISNDVIIAYLYGKSALQSPQKADSSPATASHVTASEMAANPAPLTQADGDTWLSRMRARELSFAKQAAKQRGIAPSDAPQPAPVTVKPPRAMTPAEQANHDALQKMIDASRSFGKAE